MSETPSSFVDVMNNLRSIAVGDQFNAMFGGSRDRMADAIRTYLDEYGELLRMIVSPDPVSLADLVDVRERLLHRHDDQDWRDGVNFAAWSLMGAHLRDLPPTPIDYQRAT